MDRFITLTSTSDGAVVKVRPHDVRVISGPYHSVEGFPYTEIGLPGMSVRVKEAPDKVQEMVESS